MNGTQNSGSNTPPSLDVGAVSKWLKVRGFADYAPRFAESKINMADLARLSEKDLERLGVDDPAQQARLFAEISRWKEEPSMTMQILMPGATPKAATDLPGLSNPPPARSMPAAAPPVAAAIAPHEAAVKIVHPEGSPGTAPPPEKIKLKKRWGAGFLFLSIAAHLLFGVFAYMYIVHVFTPKKLVFKGGPPSPNPNQRAMEHRVQMRKKQNAMSAPVPPKRVATTAQTKITLPDMPAMPALNSMVSPMTGMGGVGTQFGAVGMGTGGDGGGGGATMFGFRSGKNDGIIGTFYDLKQTNDRQPIPGMALPKFREVVNQFITEGWDPEFLDKYYKSPNKVRFDQLLIPLISDLLGPTCFGEEKNCKPLCWVVHYRGNVIAPESFRFRFVGGGDDWLIVRFNGKIVMEGGWASKNDGGVGPLGALIHHDGYYNLAGYEGLPRGYARSMPIDVSKGSTCSVEILFGEASPTAMSAALLIEVEGTAYKKAANGSPILPLFRTTGDPLPPPPAGTQYPPHDDNAPVWKPAPPTTNGFSSLLPH